MNRPKLIIGISLMIPLLFIFPAKRSFIYEPGNIAANMDKKSALIPKIQFNEKQNAGEYICDPGMLIEGPGIEPKIVLEGPDIDRGMLIPPPARLAEND